MVVYSRLTPDNFFANFVAIGHFQHPYGHVSCQVPYRISPFSVRNVCFVSIRTGFAHFLYGIQLLALALFRVLYKGACCKQPPHLDVNPKVWTFLYFCLAQRLPTFELLFTKIVFSPDCNRQARGEPPIELPGALDL